MPVTTDTFAPCDGQDPAVPAAPFTRLRYFYGQLLGAQDFADEQAATLMRRRLHNAILHGFGTVWGLRISDGPASTSAPRPEIVVAEGLAIDALGREIHVDREHCLDISALHTDPIWAKLPTETDAGGRVLRRAYVALSYMACLNRRAPGIAPPCADPKDLNPFSRIDDRFRLDLLEASPPAAVPDLTQPWLEARGPRANPGPWPTLRAALLDRILDAGTPPMAPLAGLWSQSGEAPLLLASVTLMHETAGGQDRTGIVAVDNSPRALLPQVQLLAEQVMGHRLAGPDARAPLTLLDVVTDEDRGAAARGRFVLVFSESLHPLTDAALREAVTLRALIGDAWTDILGDVQIAGEKIELRAQGGQLTKDTVFRLSLAGAGPSPLVARSGTPLAGWWSQGVAVDETPRDISIVRAWEPGP